MAPTERHDWLSPNAAAEYAGVSVRTVRRWIATGQLPGHRAGRRLIRIKRAELDAMLRPIPSAGPSA